MAPNRWTAQQLTALNANDLDEQLRLRVDDVTDADGFWAAATLAPELVYDALVEIVTRTGSELASRNAAADLTDKTHQAWRRSTNAFRHRVESRMGTLRPYRDAARARRSQFTAVGESLALRRALRTVSAAIRVHQLNAPIGTAQDEKLWEVLASVSVPHAETEVTLLEMVTAGPWAPPVATNATFASTP